MLRGLLRRIRGRLDLALPSDEAFVERAYREVLGREADQDGLLYYRGRLRAGEARSSVLVSLARSEEFLKRYARGPSPLPSLRALRPESYAWAEDLTNQEKLLVFLAGTPQDFDWLEEQILSSGYYEQPGVWNLGVDTDKRVMAEIVASFAPERALEIGCASGAVLSCLALLGVNAEGVEISASAAEKAPPDVRARIHRGDLLALDLPPVYDLTFGLDIFEHLNPNRLERYLIRLRELTRDGGYLFANVPAFGTDRCFGEVFPFYVDGWAEDAAAGRAFQRIHVDDLGYPLHGHLVWADTQWWERSFHKAGLVREIGIERALHAKYDSYMGRRSRARQAYFVFSKGADPGATRAIIERIGLEPSKALA